jgi:hypothetical protein
MQRDLRGHEEANPSAANPKLERTRHFSTKIRLVILSNAKDPMQSAATRKMHRSFAAKNATQEDNLS